MPKQRHARSLDLERYLSLYGTATSASNYNNNAHSGGAMYSTRDDGEDVLAGRAPRTTAPPAQSRHSSASSTYSYYTRGGGNNNNSREGYATRPYAHASSLQQQQGRRRSHHRTIDAVVLRRVFMLQHFQFIVRRELLLLGGAGASTTAAATAHVDAHTSPPSTPPLRTQPHSAHAHAQRRLLECLRSSEVPMAWEAVQAVVMRAAPDDYECRICLDYPVAPRVTECGHLFCLPCVLHYVRYQKAHDKPRLCPVCQATVVLPMLRPCVLHPVAPLRVGATARFDLFRRARNSVQLLRCRDDNDNDDRSLGDGVRDDEDDDDDAWRHDALATTTSATASSQQQQQWLRHAVPPYAHPASLQCRFVRATAAHTRQQRHLDEVSLTERLRRAVADTPRPLTAFDDGYETALREALHEVRKDAQPTSNSSNNVNGSHKHGGTPPQQPQRVAAASLSPSSRVATRAAGHNNNNNTDDGNEAVYELYAEGENGQPYYLHMLTVKMLRHDARLRGAPLPLSVSGVIDEMVSLTQDEALQRSHKAFGHVPLHGSVQLCILDVRATVLPATMQAFAAALHEREARRCARAQREEHDAAAAAAAADGRQLHCHDVDADAEEAASWRRYVQRCGRDAAAPRTNDDDDNDNNDDATTTTSGVDAAPPLPYESPLVTSAMPTPSVGATSHETDSAMTLLQLPSVASLDGGDHGLPPSTLDTRQRATKKQDKATDLTTATAATTTTTPDEAGRAASSHNCWAGGGGRRLLQRHNSSSGSSSGNAPVVATWGGHVFDPHARPSQERPRQP